MAVVEQLLDSERLRRQVGQIAVPLGLGAADLPQVWILSKNAAEALVGGTTDRDPKREAERPRRPGMLEARFQEDHPAVLAGQVPAGELMFPTPVDIDRGLFFRFYPQGHDPRPGVVQSEKIGYGVYAMNDLADLGAPGQTSSMLPWSDQLLAKARPWSDLVYSITIEAEAELMATRFPADIWRYAWTEYPEFLAIGEQVLAEGRGPQQAAPAAPTARAQLTMPAPGGAPQGYATQQPPQQAYSQPPQQQYAPQQPPQGYPQQQTQYAPQQPPAPAQYAQPQYAPQQPPQGYPQQQAPAAPQAAPGWAQPAPAQVYMPPAQPQQAPATTPPWENAPTQAAPPAWAQPGAVDILAQARAAHAAAPSDHIVETAGVAANTGAKLDEIKAARLRMAASAAAMSGPR